MCLTNLVEGGDEMADLGVQLGNHGWPAEAGACLAGSLWNFTPV